MRGHGSRCFSYKMYNRHPTQLKKSKSWEPFWSYQLNITADLANLAQSWDKWAGLAVLISWLLQNGSHDFHFFYCPGCRIFILCEIHWDPCPRIFQGYYFFYRHCELRISWQWGKIMLVKLPLVFPSDVRTLYIVGTYLLTYVCMYYALCNLKGRSVTVSDPRVCISFIHHYSYIKVIKSYKGTGLIGIMY